MNCLVQHLLHTIVRFWREQAQLSWNAACQNTDGSFTCECLSSFTGVGVQCTLGKEMFLDCVPSIGKKATLFCMADFIRVSFVHQLQRTAQNSTNLAAKRAGSSQSVRTTSRSFAFSATKPRQEGAGLSSRKDSTDPSTSTETGQATNKASVTWAASSGSGWKTSTDWQVRPTTNCELSWKTLTGTRLTQSTTRLLWQTKQTSTGCAWGATKVTSFLRFILCSEWTVRSETVTHCQPLFCRSSQCFLRTGVTCSVPLSGELCLNAARFRVVLRLSVSLAGTAGDSLARHNRMAFSTKDRDNDQDDGRDCARSLKGAWWYNKCQRSNLNGLYHHGEHSSVGDGVNWYHWKRYKHSAKHAEMKIRPDTFQTAAGSANWSSRVFAAWTSLGHSIGLRG